MVSSFMRLWWKELALQKLVGQRNPKDGAVWLESLRYQYLKNHLIVSSIDNENWYIITGGFRIVHFIYI